jgi:type VI protein secretion system component Hcp
MAVYFKFEGADGGSTDKGYEKWVIGHKYNVLGTRQLMTSVGGANLTGQQRMTGSTVLGPIEGIMNTDKSAPKLLSACLGGKPVKKVEIVETTTVGGKSELNNYFELSDVLVTLIDVGGDGKGNQQTRVLLMPTKIKHKYQEIDPKDGSVKGSVEGEADVMAGTAK